MTTSHTTGDVGPRTPIAAVWTLVVVGFGAAVRLAWWYWPGSVFSDETSGIWAALAWDFAHGVLYRPVLADLGYGGSRYMPMFFLAHGLLIRAHVDPVYAGVVLMQTSVVAAALALYGALRAAHVAPRLALPFSGTLWATIVYQRYLPDVRADYLAAAFATAGVAAAMAARRCARPKWLVLAALGCVLAGLTKVTAIAFALPIAWELARERRPGLAVRFGLGTAGLFVAAVAGLEVASVGRFGENFRAAMAAGATSPLLSSNALSSFVHEVGSDPFVALPFVISCWCALAAARRRTWALAHTYFVTVLAVTVAILTSAGTGSNQLVDLQMASTLVSGLAVARGEASARVVAPLYVALAVVLAVVSWPVPGLPSIIRTLRAEGPHRRAVVAAVHEEFLAPPALYVSTDPVIPILSGERPILLDWFNLDAFARNGAPAGLDFERRVKARVFDAIVLYDIDTFPHDMNEGDAEFDTFRATYWRTGSPLAQLVHAAYEARAVRRPFVICRPTRDPDKGR